MRRYWISIILSVFILVSLGTYYVYAAVVYFPGYKISTVSGDMNEASKISVQGNFINKGKNETLFATAEGSYNPPNRRSTFSQIFSDSRSWLNTQVEVREILENHRSFMRGKGNINSLYKDDEWIIYADAVIHNSFGAKQEIILSIDILNQTSGVVKQYKTIVNDPEDYTQVFIDDVQLIGDQIHIFIGQRSTTLANQVNLNGPQVEYHDYVVNMNSGELKSNVRVSFGDNAKDAVELFDGSTVNTLYSAPSDYALLIFRDREDNTANYMGRTYQHIYAYSYKTGVLTDMSDKLKILDIEQRAELRLDDHIISILNYKEDLIQLSRYNIDTEKLVNEDITLSAKQLDADKIIMGTVKNNKLYILFNKKEITKVAVLDATNGAILYTGEVVYEGEASESKWTMNYGGNYGGGIYMQVAD